MNLILLFQNDFTGTGSVILHGRRMEHLKKVQRAQQGDEFNIGLLNDRMGKGIILRMEPDTVEMKIVLDHEPPAPLLPGQGHFFKKGHCLLCIVPYITIDWKGFKVISLKSIPQKRPFSQKRLFSQKRPCFQKNFRLVVMLFARP